MSLLFRLRKGYYTNVAALMGGEAAEPTPLSAPELQWESTPLVNPPLLTISIPDDTLAGDHIIIEVSYDDGENWTEYLDVAVDDPDGEEQEETAGLLEQGDSLLRAFMERGVDLSDPSTEVNVTIDTVAPEIDVTNPADNATGILVGASILITFTEDIFLGAAAGFEIRATADDSLIESFDETDYGGAVTIFENTLSIDPTSALGYNTEYYVLIDADSVVDWMGQGFAGIASTTALSFTTEEFVGPATARQVVLPGGIFLNITDTEAPLQRHIAGAYVNEGVATDPPTPTATPRQVVMPSGIYINIPDATAPVQRDIAGSYMNEG